MTALPVPAIDPTEGRSIYNGTRLLGYVLASDDGNALAVGPQFEQLGSFPRVDEARRAVILASSRPLNVSRNRFGSTCGKGFNLPSY